MYMYTLSLQVNFVFSDKTGTLTENEMVFACCAIGGADLGARRAPGATKYSFV